MRDGIGYGVAAGIGAAVGFGAVGAVLGAMLALGTALAIVIGGTGARAAEVAPFLTLPLRMAHAVTWCVALVIAAIFGRISG